MLRNDYAHNLKKMFNGFTLSTHLGEKVINKNFKVIRNIDPDNLDLTNPNSFVLELHHKSLGRIMTAKAYEPENDTGFSSIRFHDAWFYTPFCEGKIIGWQAANHFLHHANIPDCEFEDVGGEITFCFGRKQYDIEDDGDLELWLEACYDPKDEFKTLNGITHVSVCENDLDRSFD